MKRALDIDEQIAKLKEHGVVFKDEEKAKEILLDVGYYRLGFYSFPFEISFPKLKGRTHELREGTSFSEIVDLYYFDYDLRRILLNALNRIEVNIRTTITYIVSNHYKSSPTWFVDPSIMQSSFISTFDDMVYNQVAKNPVIKRHHKNHINDRYAPAWKTLEFMTIGGMCALYKGIKDNNVQLKIAEKYGCTVGVFKNYLETIMFVRNKCAHGSCLYNITLPTGVSIKPANINNQTRQYISGIIGVIHYMLGRVSENRQKELEQELNALIDTPRSGQTNKIIQSCAKINLLNFAVTK